MAWYNHGKLIILNPSAVAQQAPFLLLSDVIKVSLHDSSYTMSTDSDEFYTDLSNEIAPTAYQEESLLSKTVVRDIANDRAEFDAADTVFDGTGDAGIGNGTNATFTDIVIWRQLDASTGSGADWDLLAHDDTFSATTTNGGDVTLVWNTEGILHIS